MDGVDVSDPAAVAQALAVDDSLLLRVTFAAVVDPATLVAGSTDGKDVRTFEKRSTVRLRTPRGATSADRSQGLVPCEQAADIFEREQRRI